MIRENDIIRISDPSSTSNEKLTFFIKNITGTAVSLNSKTYFSPEEYKIGTKILVKDLKISDNSYYDSNFLDKSLLENFINYEYGHYIIGLGESNKYLNSSRCKMYNQIQIPLSYSLDKTTGKSTIKDDFKLKKNIIGKVAGDISTNTTTTVALADTDDSTYYNLPITTSDYYNNKTLIFTGGTSSGQSTTITDYSKDNSNRLIATMDTITTKPVVNDTYKINMYSSVSSGRLINLDLQNILSFKITTLKKDNSIFKENL